MCQCKFINCLKCTTLEVDFDIDRIYVCVVVLVVKNPTTNAQDMSDASSVPQLRRYSGGGNGNPLQYLCLGNPMDNGAWRATAHWVTKIQTRLRRLSTSAHTCTCKGKQGACETSSPVPLFCCEPKTAQNKKSN